MKKLKNQVLNYKDKQNRPNHFDRKNKSKTEPFNAFFLIPYK